MLQFDKYACILKFLCYNILEELNKSQFAEWNLKMEIKLSIKQQEQ